MTRDPLRARRPAATLTWDAVLAWRCARHLLGGPDTLGAPATPTTVTALADRLCGVQAQVPGSARDAIAWRLHRDVTDELGAALREGRLLRTWAARGTLHLLTPPAAADQLAVLASARTWLQGSWQRSFATAAQVERLAEVVPELLGGRPLTRTELVDGILAATGDDSLAEHLSSGWATVLKPLAWRGLLCQAPADGSTGTLFTRPDLLAPGWTLAPVDEAGPRVVLAYLGAYGPALPDALNAWLLRGRLAKPRLQGWFAQLADDGLIAAVEVAGEPRWARAADVDSLAGAHTAATTTGEAAVEAAGEVLLPGFDPYVLGVGTADPDLVPAAHRGRVSRAGGWISPVVLEGGRVVGVWSGSRADPEVERFDPM